MAEYRVKLLDQRKGDLLVTSDTPDTQKSVAGVDMGRSVFAKSLTQDTSDGAKIIEVAII